MARLWPIMLNITYVLCFGAALKNDPLCSMSITTAIMPQFLYNNFIISNDYISTVHFITITPFVVFKYLLTIHH